MLGDVGIAIMGQPMIISLIYYIIRAGTDRTFQKPYRIIPTKETFSHPQSPLLREWLLPWYILSSNTH